MAARITRKDVGCGLPVGQHSLESTLGDVATDNHVRQQYGANSRGCGVTQHVQIIGYQPRFEPDIGAGGVRPFEVPGVFALRGPVIEAGQALQIGRSGNRRRACKQRRTGDQVVGVVPQEPCDEVTVFERREAYPQSHIETLVDNIHMAVRRFDEDPHPRACSHEPAQHRRHPLVEEPRWAAQQ